MAEELPCIDNVRTKADKPDPRRIRIMAPKPLRRDAAPPKGTTINLRAPAPLRDLIDRAASALGQTRTEFMLESSRRHAEDVLLDRRLFSLSDGAYQQFLHLLDEPPPPGDALKALLAAKSPWEK
jgi:uncharacterized protein (DUF1778 family)